jgi:2-phospho-L-lactate guanylyltransferase
VTSLTILIPCKALGQGKTRLAPLLTPEARRDLCTAFLAQTLELALSVVPARRLRVVTGDPTVVRKAKERGIASLGDPGEGPNAALAAARDTLLAEGQALQSLLVLPTDLPLATGADLRTFLAAAGDLVLAPDAAGTGTNLLLLRPRALRAIRFVFGPDSLRLYRGMAERARLVLTIVANDRLALDIDRPEDFQRWQAFRPAGR